MSAGPSTPADPGDIIAAIAELARQVRGLSDLRHRTEEVDALVRSIAWGVQSELDTMRTALTAMADRHALPAPAPNPFAAKAKPLAWTQYATAQQWRDLAAWVNWLVDTYDLQPSRTVLPCWPAHLGVTEELAAVHSAWREAATTARTAKPGTAMSAWHDRWLHPCLTRIRESYQTRGCDDKHKPVRPGHATDETLLQTALQNAPPPPRPPRRRHRQRHGRNPDDTEDQRTPARRHRARPAAPPA